MMERNIVVRERKIHGRTKVKTGCATCRIRKVKCDENKPFCHRCVNTGRTCDGYESLFRSCVNQPVAKLRAGHHRLDGGSQPLFRPILTEISLEEIDLLNRYFSTKTIFNVNLGCNEEARQALKASLTDPPVQHAVSALRVLRENLQTFDDGRAPVARQTPSYKYGLNQYGIALSSLASNLSSATSGRLRSALICCEIFISIEQVQGNFAAMAQHIIRGLRIMHEYRARPEFTAASKLVPAHHDPLPLLDVFVIKLFAAPCKFVERPATNVVHQTALPVCVTSPCQKLAESHNLRIIAPDMRTELTRIAASMLIFLDKVSRVESVGVALRLQSEKAALLGSLETWLIDLELSQAEIGPSLSEPISVSFMRLFYFIMKIILLGTLDYSPDLYSELQSQTDRLQGVADSVDERLKTYKTYSRTSEIRDGRPKVQ